MTDDEPKPRRGRPAATTATKPLHILIPSDLSLAIDAHLDEMRGMQPDSHVTRADAARALLRRGIITVERRKADRARDR